VIAFLLLAALHATPAPTVNSEPYTHAQSRVDIGDGRHMNLYCIGNGSPTVIFDSGLGVGSGTLPWNHVQPYVAQFTRACAYDRAGYGFSDPGPLPRTSDAVVSDLHALLARAGIRPPYVLVAHSIAGLYEPLFADRYPAEVAGMVLVDPSAPGQEELFSSQYPKYAAYEDQQLTKLHECADDPAQKQCQLPPDPHLSAAHCLEGPGIRTREHR
jgi:pimeloyl-ACP methyl ester carboxylesterase